VAVRIETDREGRPRAIGGPGRFRIIRVQDRWRIDDEWWREKPVSRLYYQVLLEDRRHITIFHDLMSSCWYEQDYA